MEGYKVLGFDIKAALDGFELRYSVWANVALAIMSVLAIGIQLVQTQSTGYSRAFSMATIAIIVAAVPVEIIAMIGFLWIGTKDRRGFLINACILNIIAIPVLALPSLVLEFMKLTGRVNVILEVGLLIPMLFIAGAVYLIFGLALWAARDSRPYRIVSSLNIAMGLFLMSIILTFIGAFLQVPLLLAQAWVLSMESRPKATEKSDIEPVLVE